jgi:cystathionine beta-synthase
MFAALQAATRLREGQNCVVVLPDGVRNYMSKFVDDKWMRDNGYFQTKTVEGRVQDILATERQRPQLVVASDTDTLREVIELMRVHGISQVPVSSGEVLVGIVTEGDLMAFLGSGEGSPDSLVSKVMTRHVAVVGVASPISALEEMLSKNTAVVVVGEARHPIGILTRIDLLHYLTLHQPV